MRKFIMPLVITIFGLLWLMDVKNLIPDLNYLWTMLLAGIGASILATRGFNKDGFPWGAFFLACAVCSVLRQTGRLELRAEVPLLVVILGVILFINQTGLVPPAGPKQPPQS